MNFDIQQHTILEMVHGSHAYGLARPESDLDIRGIAIPPRRYFFGYHSAFEQKIGGTAEEPDTVIFDIRKFFKLAAECNPNVLELLWVPEKHIRMLTPWGEKLIANRGLFLSKKAKFTFSGYAISQLKRIETHRRWLLEPPDHKPTRKEFGLSDRSVLSPDIQGAIASIEKNNPSDLERTLSREVMEVYHLERSYHNALRIWQQYEEWKKSRNPARAKLEEKFGYDTKHGMHLVRLLRMCREILTTGQVLVERPDKEELAAIRAGAWKFDDLINWAKAQDEESDKSYHECTILPHSPNVDKLETLCEELVTSFLANLK